MGIHRSTDPTTWDDVDGIVVNESAPAPNIAGVASNVAILVGQTQRGSADLTEVGSIGEFHELYGKDSTKGVNKALKSKKFGRLRIIRVIPTGSDVAELTLDDGGGTPANILKVEAKQGPGAYGNNIQIKVEAGSSSGKKYTIKDTTPGTVMTQEVYDNVQVASIAANQTFAGSKLVTVTVLATSAEPENMAFTALAGGSDGAVADGDYEDAIEKAGVEQAGNFLFLDEYNSTRNGYLKTHVADNPDKMVILAGLETDTVANAIADVATYRDTEGRIIYAYPWVQTSIDGVSTYVNPASFMASILSQTAPHIDPAYTLNSQFLSGVTNLKVALTRANYIALKDAGICAFEYDQEIGFKVKSGITTQIADTSKVTVLRRRMADYLTNSVGKFLKNYQNAVNSKENRTLVKGAIMGFITSLENDGILPKDSDVTDGKAKLVDTESLNTADSIAQGYFKILWKQRIHSAMRFIVLQAEIGESVVVTEQ